MFHKVKIIQFLMNRLPYYLGFLLFCLNACIPYQEEEFSEIKIDLSDPEFQQIFDFRDRQLADSLIGYFRHKNPNYRYSAALAFGSFQDTSAIDALSILLQDDIDEVRAAAAFSIGQIGHPKGASILIQNFNQNDTTGQYRKANRAILEAVGKCGDLNTLKLLSTTRTYQVQDTALLQGQCWGIYRFAMREITAPEGTSRMVRIATNDQYPDDVRFIAASYLANAADIQVDSFTSPVSRSFFKEEDERIRMALAIALGKTGSPTALNVLLNQLKLAEDYRVKTNILRSLGNFDYEVCKEAVVEALEDPQLQVSQRAAQYFYDFGSSRDATDYWRMAKDSLPWQTQLMLYRATQKHLPPFYANFRSSINGELRRRLRRSQNPYEKAGVMGAMAEFGWNYRNIHDDGLASEDPVVRTASMEALQQISDRQDFRSFFGLGSRRVERELCAYFEEGLRSGDPGLMTPAAIALRNPAHSYTNYLDSLNFMDSILLSIERPRHIETYNELKTTIAVLKGQDAPPPQIPGYNHPIDWALLSDLTIEPQVLMRTTKGVIKLRLLPDIAPGSSANFIQLAQEGFYNGKVFHRVVPNFVIQSGCTRGDGYGSKDYTIRSELTPLHYDQEGFVGMASSGRHTESTQFFITHSPTPTLDGRYTIFARVIDGMPVVSRIEVGDRIEELRIVQ